MNVESATVRRTTAMQESLNDVLHKLREVHGPQWEARNDFVRNLVSIAAAIFAGTITFFDQLLVRPERLSSWTVLASWFLLLLSIAVGLYGLWHGTLLGGVPTWFFYTEKELEKKMAALPDNATTEDEIAAVRSGTDELLRQVEKSDKRGALAAKWCIRLFAAALACF